MLQTFPQFFYYVEEAPLLCILEDFLPQLDSFFLRLESNLDVRSFAPDVPAVLRVWRNEYGNKLHISEREARMTAEKTSAEKVWTGLREMVEGSVVEELYREVTNLDEEYVHTLELYCLLKQTLLDVRQNWREVAKRAFSDHSNHASEKRRGKGLRPGLWLGLGARARLGTRTRGWGLGLG